jgi:hypothetical protein
LGFIGCICLTRTLFYNKAKTSLSSQLLKFNFEFKTKQSEKKGSAFTASLPQQFAHNIEKIQDTIIGTTKDQIESIASGLNTRGQPSVADATQQLAALPLKFAQNVQQLQGPIALATQQVAALPQQFAHNIDQIQDTIVAKAKEQVAALAQAAASLRSPAKRGMVEQLASNMGMMPGGDR